MVNFANPELLYLLIAVAVFALLYWRMRFLRRRRIARFGDPAVLAGLMPDVSKYLPTVKIVVALAALTSMCVMLARPRTKGKVTEEEMSGIEVMIAVDVSNSMLASSTDDPRGIARLQRAKHVLNSLLGKLDNDRVGLIVFAGDAFTQLPLTPDFVSAKLYLNEISTGMVENQGTDIGAAIQVAMNSFSGMKDVERAIVVITDAEDQIGDAVSVAKAAHDEGIEVDVIGLGSGKGAQIPLDRSFTNWLKDENGQVVTTYLNEQLAQEIAAAGGGVYINGASATALNELAGRLDEIKKTNFGKINYTANDEQFPVFAWLALLLVIIDCIFSNRKIGFLRKYNFFSRSASVAFLALTAGLAAQAQAPMAPALQFPDNSLRPERRFIREGNEEFRAGHYREAEILYARALNANPTSEVGLYNQALTRLHLAGTDAEANKELKQNAIQTMETLLKAQNPKVAEYAAYNLGNVAYEAQQLQSALESYKQALRKNPANELARENYRFVEKQIEKQQNQNQNQNQEQQEDKQDQQQQQQENQEQNQQQQQQQQNQQQQQQNQQQQNQQQQQKEQNISRSNRDQILNAVEKKDAAARARAKGDPAKGGGQRSRGRNW